MKLTDIKTIAKKVRKELKATFPDVKFSVTIERFSMGQAMNVALMSAPFQTLCEESGYSQLNEYVLRRKETYAEYVHNGREQPFRLLTEKGHKVMREVERIANQENWNNSDSMIDYFDVNYYLHLAIGKWDKAFEVK